MDVQAQMRQAIQEPRMQKFNITRIVVMLRKLTQSELKAVSAEVTALEDGLGATAIIEGRFAAGAFCPNCHGCDRRKYW